jgi:type IV pilus assembly protein PilE
MMHKTIPSTQTFDREQRGFTLVELMIAVAIVAILAAIALPSYQESVQKGKRSDAKTGLVDAASRLEQFYLDNKTYTTDMTDLGYGAATNVDTTDGYYKMTVAASAGCTIASCFTVSAVPQGGQASDSCGTLTINSKGAKTPSDCW